MDVVQACEMFEKKLQQHGAQQHAGRSRELHGSKRNNKISRNMVWSANKCHPTGGQARGGALQANQTPDVGQLVFLGEHVRAMLTECAPSGSDAARVEACLDELRALVGEVGEGWSLEIFGSLASLFSTNCSDVDATCYEEGGKPWEAHAAARFLREKVVPLLPGHPKLTITEEVLNAKVPILRLRFDGRLDIDLSCQNTQALRNTRYLRAYANIDQRVRDLGIAVKLWAKGVGVCGAAQGHLSSYTFTLLVIYFMQVHPDVLLPCLPTYAFEEGMAGESDSQVKELSSSWSCSLGLPQLLARFFWFYTREFMWGLEVASPRLGRRLYAREQQFQQLRGRWATRLHVEDPFKLERNLHHVLGELEEARLCEMLEQGLFAILMGGVPAGLHRVPAGEDASGEASDVAKDADGAGDPEPDVVKGDATPSKAAEERTASPCDSRSRTCSTESGGTCCSAESGGTCSTSTESGGEEPKAGASPDGSFSNSSSQPSDEDSEVLPAAVPASAEGVQPARWQRRQQPAPVTSRQGETSPIDSQEEAQELGEDSSKSEEGGQQEDGEPVREENPWWRSLGSANIAGATGTRAQDPDRAGRTLDYSRAAVRQEGNRQRWLWRCAEQQMEEGKQVSHLESAPMSAALPASVRKEDKRLPVCLTVQDLEDKMGRGPSAHDAEKRQPVCLTVQDLEDKMGRGPGTAAAAAPAAATPARPFAAMSTNKIASRVSKACMALTG